MTVTVYETDLGVYLNKNGAFKNLEWKSGKEMVTVEIDDVSDLKGDNAVVVARMQAKCFPIFKDGANTLIRLLKKVDAIEDKSKRAAAEAKAFDQFRDVAVKELMDLAQEEFGDLLKNNRDYKDYKQGLGLRLAIGGAGFVASAALALAGAWTGIGIIVGAVAMGRSAVALAQQIANAASEAETIQARIETNGKKLAKQLESDTIKTNTAKQVAETVINKLFAVEIEKILVTVDALHEDFERMESKVKGMKSNAMSLVEGIDGMLDKQQKAAKEFEPLKKLFEQTKTLNLDYTKAKIKLSEAEADLDKAVSGASGLMERVEKAAEWSSKNYKVLSDIKGKYNANAVKAAKIATELVTALGSFAAGSWTDPNGTIKSLKGVSLAASVGFANDSVQVVHDVHVALKKKAGAG